MIGPFVPRNVQQAAVFLDRRLPGWEGYVNLSELEMESSYRCVLGQLWQFYPEFAGRTWGAWSSPYSQMRSTLDVSGHVFTSRDDKWRKAVTLRLGLPSIHIPAPEPEDEPVATPDAGDDLAAELERLRRLEARIKTFAIRCDDANDNSFIAHLFASDIRDTLRRILDDQERWYSG